MNDQLDVYDSKEYKKSGFAYKMECTFEYFVAILIADAYLSNMLTAIGMPDRIFHHVSCLLLPADHYVAGPARHQHQDVCLLGSPCGQNVLCHALLHPVL